MPGLKLGPIALIYALLFAAAFGWSLLRGDGQLFILPGWPLAIEEEELQRAMLLGFCSGAAAVLASRLLSTYFLWAQRLDYAFRSLLGPLKLWQIFVLALLSSVAEEAFFRGALQPSLGLLPTALLFGALHVGPSWRFLPWTLMAFGLGLWLGYLFNITGTLAAPIVCHATINLLELIAIQNAPEIPEPEEDDADDDF